MRILTKLKFIKFAYLFIVIGILFILYGWFFTANTNNGEVKHSTFKTDNSTSPKSGGLNINTASFSELDLLPGIGEKTAQKIISNRPFSTLNELLTRKVLSKKVFENLKGQLRVE